MTPPSPSPSLAQLVISHETGISDKATTNNSDSTGSKVILKASKAESCTTTGTHDTTTNAVNTSKNTQNAKQLSGHENENGSLHAMRAMLLGRDIVAALIQPYGNGNSNGDSHGNGVDAQVTYDERVSHLKKSIEGMTFESDGEWDGDGDDNCLITGRSANDEVINSGPNDLPSVKCDPLPSNTPQRIFTSLDISNILRTASAIDWFVL